MRDGAIEIRPNDGDHCGDRTEDEKCGEGVAWIGEEPSAPDRSVNDVQLDENGAEGQSTTQYDPQEDAIIPLQVG